VTKPLRALLACLLPALVAFGATQTHAAEQTPPALADTLRGLCSQLKQHGWAAPKDPSGGASRAEFDIPGVAYFCNLERPHKGAGPGHSPLLQALISDSGDEPSVIFSADIWCAADRGALAALGDQIDKQLAAVSLRAPADMLAAVREGRKSETVAQGLRYETAPIDVDAQACGKVPENGLGAVLMKIDVSIKPADGKAHRAAGRANSPAH
jgi:hypothetical protein